MVLKHLIRIDDLLYKQLLIQLIRKGTNNGPISGFKSENQKRGVPDVRHSSSQSVNHAHDVPLVCFEYVLLRYSPGNLSARSLNFEPVKCAR